MSEDGTEIIIKMKIWYLAQVIDSDNWQKCILEECQRLIIMHINKMKNPNEVKGKE